LIESGLMLFVGRTATHRCTWRRSAVMSTWLDCCSSEALASTRSLRTVWRVYI